MAFLVGLIKGKFMLAYQFERQNTHVCYDLVMCFVLATWTWRRQPRKSLIRKDKKDTNQKVNVSLNRS